MKIYIAHSRNFDFQNELYKPIKRSFLVKENSFIFPHEGAEDFDSKAFLKDECDLIIAEASHPSTGMGIELGWADMFKIPIICVYKTGTEISNSLKVVTDKFLEYSDTDDLIIKINEVLK